MISSRWVTICYILEESSGRVQNQEIRHKILVQLYKQYYDEGFAHATSSEDIFKEAGITSDIANLAFTNTIAAN